MDLNKYLITPLRQRFSAARISDAQVRRWMDSWKFFFILGFGRSGTVFMADLLNQAPGAHVFHEPVLEDVYAHLRAYYSPLAAQRYMCGFRVKEICARMRGVTPGVYGEVNGMLHFHGEAVRKAFPNAAILHLVRDGRDVVRSTIPRRTMTYKNPLSLQMHPLASDPWYSRWPSMDRFARICWYWKETNARLRNSVGSTVQFEKILSSYEYFEAEVLQPCQVNIDRKVWQAAVGSPKNTTARHEMPKWEGWSAEQQRVFTEICGEEMASCGYSV